MVVLDDSEEYSIYDDRGRVFELAGIRTHDEAVAFASKHGLLWHGAAADYLREPFSEWLAQAAMMTRLTLLHSLILLAVKGDADAIAELRTSYEPVYGEMFELPVDTDADVVHRASIVLAGLVSEGLKGTDLGISVGLEWEGGQPGEFRTIAHPPHLLGAIYHELSLLIAQRWQMLACPECGRTFIPTDARQRYCSPACSNRARYKRFTERQRQREFAAVDAGTAEP